MASSKTRKWKESIENLLLKTIVCGVCLSEPQEYDHWDSLYHIETEKKEASLKELLVFTFGLNVKNLVATPYFCEKCVTTILESYLLLKKMRLNHIILGKYLNIVSQQIKLSAQTETEGPTEKQLMLTIDNMHSLNVPTTVTIADKKPENKNITQIFLCELNDLDASETELLESQTTVPVLKYECPYCGKQFDSYKGFKHHHIQHKDTFYSCVKCSKKFKGFEDLTTHRFNTHSDVLLTCKFCKIILLSPESKEHEEDHSLTCKECKIHFNQKNDHYKHMLEHHCVCQHCLKTFSNQFKLEHHRCIYKCFECKDECIHKSYLTSYREQHMAQMSSFKCPDCDFEYTTRSQLICHVNEKHLQHLPYLCDVCGENFASRPLLTSHIYKNHSYGFPILGDKSVGPIVSSGQFECDLCLISFNSEETYAVHRKRHLTGENECQFCDETFTNIGKLNIHIKKEHPDEVNSKTAIYQCSMCPLDFDFRSDFLQHKSTHQKGTKHVCRLCNESFQSKINYVSHIRRHKFKNDKQCPICLKKYQRHTIKRHIMGQHFGEKTEDIDTGINKCDICGILLSSQGLIKHAKKHKEERQCPHCDKYVNSVLFEKHINIHAKEENRIMKNCSECDYTTRFNTCLEAHMNRKHLKIRPYVCHVCDKTFYASHSLNCHKLTHKKEKPEHYCLICCKKFKSLKALKYHTRIHTGETPYPCELCELSFLSASRRRSHMIRKHFEPSFECQICQKKQYTNSDLKRHVSDCHTEEGKRKKKKLGQQEYEDQNT